MAYSQGGVIAATDYNNFINGSNQLNTVWSTGSGNAGYGQTAIATVSAAGTVTAAQWASLINSLNSTLVHQSGTGSGISATTAGSTINYLSTLATNVNTAYTNRLNKTANGSTTTGTVFTAGATATNDATYNGTILTRTVTFASANQARYFFNAGGYINFVITGVTNNDSTARSTDAVNVIATYLNGVSAFRAAANNGRTGTGGTTPTNNLAFGYYNLTTSYQTTQQVNTTNATYSNDYAAVQFKSNGVQGANGDVGSQISLALNYQSAHTSGFNDTLNITVSHRIDVVYPETTNLTNSWGTVTIA